MLVVLAIALCYVSVLFVLRGTIVSRAYGVHKNLPWYVVNNFYQLHLVLLTMVRRNSIIFGVIILLIVLASKVTLCWGVISETSLEGSTLLVSYV